MNQDSNSSNIFIVSSRELKENMTPDYFSFSKDIFKFSYNSKKLKEITEIKRSKMVIDKYKIYNYISIKDVNQEIGQINFKNIIAYLGRDIPTRASKIPLNKNDIIVSLVRPEIGNIALINKDLPSYIVSNAFVVIHPKKEEDAKYIYFMLRSKSILNQMGFLRKGLIPNINKSQLIQLMIPYPNNEIRDKVKSIFDQYYRIYKDLKGSLKLKYDKITSMLKDEFQIERKEKNNEKPCFIVKSTELDNQFNVDYYKPTSDYFEINNMILKYKTKKLGEIASIKRGKNVRREYLLPYGYIYLKSGNIDREFIDLDNVEYVNPEQFEKFKNYFTNSKDILLNLYASDVESTGKAVLIPEDLINLIFNDGIAKLSIKNGILGHYFVSFLNLEMTRFKLFRISTGTIIRRISLKNLEQLPIIIPDLQWQKQFVENKLNLLREIKEIKSKIKNNKFRLENQLKEILELKEFEV